jgi:ribosomal protein S18 acetylase RimI-like enzyme
MNIRKGTTSDIPQVLALQETYLLANTKEEDKEQGFVSTPFSAEQLQEVIDFGGFYVAENESKKVIAYLVVCSWDFFTQWPTFKYMASRFPQLTFDGKPVSTENSFEYGPICIDKAYRNQGIAEKLFTFMCKDIKRRYPIGVTFINKLNHRSFNAHTNKLGLKVIDEFSFNGHNFYTLAFKTSK